MSEREEFCYYAGVVVGLFIGWCWWYRSERALPRPIDPPPQLGPATPVTVIVFEKGKAPFVQEPAEA